MSTRLTVSLVHGFPLFATAHDNHGHVVVDVVHFVPFGVRFVRIHGSCCQFGVLPLPSPFVIVSHHGMFHIVPVVVVFAFAVPPSCTVRGTPTQNERQDDVKDKSPIHVWMTECIKENKRNKEQGVGFQHLCFTKCRIK